MSRRERKRLSRVTLATVLFLVVTFNSPPSIQSIQDPRPAPPSSEELMVLEQLSDWVLEEDERSIFRAADERGLFDVVSSRRQSFELFRRYHDEGVLQDLARDLPYGDLIVSAARRYRVDSLLLAAVVEAESGFNSQAVSSRGALGLMQLMPATAELFGLSDPLEPKANLEVGARYLRNLIEEFDGDLTLALASYNAGPGNVLRYGGIPPFRETRGYVDRVLKRYVDHHQSAWKRSGARELLLF